MLTVPGGRPWTAATHCGLVLLTAVTPGLRVLLQADTSLQDVSKVIVLPGFILRVGECEEQSGGGSHSLAATAAEAAVLHLTAEQLPDDRVP